MSVRLVDSAQYENRLRDFDFDVLVGLKNPAVDKLVDRLIAAPDRASLVTRTRALDRALQWNFLVVPHWHIPYDRIAFWDKFGYPGITPLHGVQLDTWWIDPAKDGALSQQRVAPGWFEIVGRVSPSAHGFFCDVDLALPTSV
ncbi:MAG: hypothetical protein P9F19_02780 [Candidatus Contendobacter sp.]|nr:hypothetical protein [Candidatus Contendobacter sp.]